MENTRKPVAVVRMPPGAQTAEVVARFDSIGEAEAYIAKLHRESPESTRAAIERGDYGIDGEAV